MTVKDTDKQYRVFLEHHLGEMECAPEVVQQHIQLSGSLPVVGKPLLTLPRNAPFQDKNFALPYGKVTRVEECES